LRFLDYKCEVCKNITEVTITGDNKAEIKCSKCGSKNMVRVFSSVGFKNPRGGDGYSGSSSSCSTCMGGSCSTCTGGR